MGKIMKNLKIMKFGGASLSSEEKIMHVANLVDQASMNSSVILIVSAMLNVTNTLIDMFHDYKLGNMFNANAKMKALFEKHEQVLKELELSKKDFQEANSVLINLFGTLCFYLSIHHRYTKENYDYVVSFGERLSSHLVSVALQKLHKKACAIDASKVIVASKQFNNAKVFLQATQKNAHNLLLPLVAKNIIPVVPGFFASAKDGTVVTLGRGGSDYSATVLAHVLDANEVVLWKEVNGVYSGDPKKNLQAIFYPQLSYEKALELAKKGAKILHPEAMKPVLSKKIVVWVKNTFNPQFAGTKICEGRNIL